MASEQPDADAQAIEPPPKLEGKSDDPTMRAMRLAFELAASGIRALVGEDKNG